MDKQTKKTRVLDQRDSRRRRRAGDTLHDLLREVGREAGTQASATSNTAEMTIQEAEIKISMGIMSHLEKLTLDELLKTLQFILDLEKHRSL